MKILILSKEAWRDEQNGGNVLSNIFKDFDATFAQIYCTDLHPNNNLCHIYYQMTDKMMINNILHREHIGKVLKYDVKPQQSDQIDNVESYSGVKRFNSELIRVAREIVWSMARWDKEEIKRFVYGFNPDVIFAPCYGNHYMIRLTKLVRSYVNVPVISYISDDFYSNKQYNFSLAFWINHFLLRKHVRDVFKLYSLVYTMTDAQKKQCERDFGANMKILRKSGSFDSEYKGTLNEPIQMVYAGGLYLNRWKTLTYLTNAIKKINAGDMKVQLHIYSNTPLKERQRIGINDGKNSIIHEVVSSKELKDIYRKSDIALHVEGFDLKNRLTVRMSFSTKIIDCLDSRCAVMAICDNSQAGYQYLRDNEIAFCIDDCKKIEYVLREVVDNPQLILDMQKKAYDFGRMNHNKDVITKGVVHDFKEIIALQ